MKQEKGKKKDDQPTVNIWQQILSEANTKNDLEESNLFIFGEKNVGKKSLIKVLNKEYLQKFDYEGK